MPACKNRPPFETGKKIFPASLKILQKFSTHDIFDVSALIKMDKWRGVHVQVLYRRNFSVDPKRCAKTVENKYLGSVKAGTLVYSSRWVLQSQTTAKKGVLHHVFKAGVGVNIGHWQVVSNAP